MIFPLQEPPEVSRAFLEIKKNPELKIYITFLRTPKMIEVNFSTLCHIFTMSQSLQRVALNKTLITILNNNVDATYFFANERSEVGDEKTSYVDLFPCNVINSNLVHECNPAMYKRVF